MSTPWSWSRGSRRQADTSRRYPDEVRWSRKVMEMGQGTDKDKKGKKGGCTMTDRHIQMWQCSRARSVCGGAGAVQNVARVDGRWWAHSECTNQTRGGL